MQDSRQIQELMQKGLKELQSMKVRRFRGTYFGTSTEMLSAARSKCGSDIAVGLFGRGSSGI